MNRNLKLVDEQYNRHRHDDDQNLPEPESPSSEELQQLVGQLAEALDPRTKPSGHCQTLRLRNFRSERLRLTDDLIVVLEDRDGEYIAESYDTGQYGHGYSPDDAIESLCSVLEDYYDLLCEDEARLSESLRAHLRFLREILQERA